MAGMQKEIIRTHTDTRAYITYHLHIGDAVFLQGGGQLCLVDAIVVEKGRVAVHVFIESFFHHDICSLHLQLVVELGTLCACEWVGVGGWGVRVVYVCECEWTGECECACVRVSEPACE